MAEPVEPYVVAIRRTYRESVPDDWASQLNELDGVEVPTARRGTPRVRVLATPEGIERVREHLGDVCMVEPVIEHHLSSTDDADVAGVGPTTADRRESDGDRRTRQMRGNWR